GAGLNVIDSDASRSEVTGESFGEPDDSGLGQGVHRPALKRHAIAVAASDMDDAPAVAHVTDRFLRRHKHAFDVHCDHLFEGVERELIDGGDDQRSSIVYQDVEAAEGLYGLG